MLDAIEAGILALRSRPANGTVHLEDAPAAVELRAELQAAGVSAAEFARAASIPQHRVEAWAAGTSPVPEWVSATIRLMSLLTPSARRKLLYGPAGVPQRPANCHPFSRIEEL